MRISLLLQREPFGSILEQTLARFLESWTGRPHEVHWYPGRPDLEAMRRRGLQPWLCNVYLNGIFVPEAEPQIFDPVRREFGYSLVWWRRPFQEVYVALATSRPWATWLAQAGVGISPALPEAEQLLMVAGNHKVRLLYHAAGMAYGILKSGFPPHFMEREIEARRQAEELGLPVPRLEAVAEDGAWFRERYISGTPINRLADGAVAGRAVADAARALHRLLEHTQREESLEDYAEGLRARIQQLVRANRLLSEPEKQSLLRSTDAILQQISGQRSAVSGRIVTALTHGDFQPANILVDQEGTWLIDWEYSAWRQAGYDALVFATRSRFPTGLAARLRRIVGEGDSIQPLSLADWPGLHWQRPAERGLHVMVFLLEELLLYLEENSNPLFRCPGQALLDFHREVWPSLEALGVPSLCSIGTK